MSKLMTGTPFGWLPAGPYNDMPARGAYVLPEVTGLPRTNPQGEPWRDPQDARIDDVVALITKSKRYRRKFFAINGWQAMFAYAGSHLDPYVWSSIIKLMRFNETPRQFIDRFYMQSRRSADIMDLVSRRGLGATRPA